MDAQCSRRLWFQIAYYAALDGVPCSAFSVLSFGFFLAFWRDTTVSLELARGYRQLTLFRTKVGRAGTIGELLDDLKVSWHLRMGN